VFDAAGEALRIADIEAHFLKLRRAVGPPWNKDHKLALAAAIVTASVVDGTAGNFRSRRK
jgi:hypothetical protein